MVAREELVSGYPPLGGAHKNGDRIYGYSSGLARHLAAAGTPNVSSLPARHLTEAVASVRINDRLDVEFAGEWWNVVLRGEVVGRLPFSAESRGQDLKYLDGKEWDQDSGVLIVERLKISGENQIVNLGGTLYPLGHPRLT